jgi:outer membrane protein assembly factor BamB
MGALLLRARAFTALKDREGVTQTAESLLAQLGKKAARRLERDAAKFCRDAVALLAPERNDLLRSLRGLADGRQDTRWRKVALVGALLVAAAGAGVVWWPESAGGLLDDARSSAEAGDKPRALDLLGRLIEKFPESTEANEAMALQAQIQPAAPKTRPAASAKKAGPALPPLPAALAALPAPEALAQVLPHLETLAAAGTATTTAPALPADAVKALGEAVTRFTRSVRGRVDALSLTRDARERSKDKAPVLRKVIDEATHALDPATIEAWQACVPALVTLAGAAKSASLQRELTTMPALLEAYARARSVHAVDLLECRRLLAGLELEELHVACREQAPRLLVAGRLDDVEHCYTGLETRLNALAAEPDMAPVLEDARRRLVPDFLRERQTLLRGIRSGLAAAKAAEEAGDLEAAGKAYAAVAKRHYTVRFDDVIQVPLRIEASPVGAEVKVNGASAGNSPLTIHYGWGVPVTVSVQAPGFEPMVRVLEARDGVPVTRLDARLKPRLVWSASLEGTFEARPLPVGDDMLVCDRSGRVSLHAFSDGHEIWARHLKNVEGIRARAATDGERIVLAFVDGQVVMLDAHDGSVAAEEKVARPSGDVVALEGTVAVVVGTPAVVAFEHGRTAWTTPLSAAATTSLVPGHGAFWLGTGAGALVRLDSRTGDSRVVPLPAPSVAVTTLVPMQDGWLACLGDGRLLSLSADGTLRWTAPNLGDLGPAPVTCAGLVAVSDRRGRVTLLDETTGAPRGTAALRAEPAGGLLALGNLIVATTQDGRLWALDPATAVVRVDATLSEKGLSMPASFPGGDLAVVAREGRLVRVPAPSVPPSLPAPAPAPAPVEPVPVEGPAR